MPDIFDQITDSPRKDIFDELFIDQPSVPGMATPGVVSPEQTPQTADMGVSGGEDPMIPQSQQVQAAPTPRVDAPPRQVVDMGIAGGEDPMTDIPDELGTGQGFKEVGLSATTEPMKDFLNTAIAAAETRQKGKYTFIDPNEEAVFKRTVRNEQQRLNRDLTESELDELRQMYQSTPPEAAQKQLKGWGDLLKKSEAALPDMPDRERGKFLQAMMGMARFAPAMVATAVSGTGGAAVTLSQLYGAKYGEYRDNGIEPEDADAAAFASAIMSTPVEFAGNVFQLKLLKPLAKSFGLSTKASTRAIEFLTHARASTMGNLAAVGGRVVAGGATEGMEEGIQAYAEAAGDILAQNPDDDVQGLLTKFNAHIATPEFAEQRNRAIELGMIGGTVLGGAGQGMAMMTGGRTKPEATPEQPGQAIEPEQAQLAEAPVTETKRDIFDEIADVDRGKRVAPVRTAPVRSASKAPEALPDIEQGDVDGEWVAINQYLVENEPQKGSVPARKPYLETRSDSFAKNLKDLDLPQSNINPGMEDARYAIYIGNQLGYRPNDIAAYLQRNFIDRPADSEVAPEPPPQEASDSTVAETPQEKAKESVGFITAKGSKYVVNKDGTTVRDKATRPEHPGEEGVQPRSKKTWYVGYNDVANKLSLVQAKGGSGRATVAELPNGQIAVKYTSGVDAGKFIKGTIVTPQKNPAIGLIPVEYFGDNRTIHFGNKITKIKGKPVPQEVLKDYPDLQDRRKSDRRKPPQPDPGGAPEQIQAPKAVSGEVQPERRGDDRRSETKPIDIAANEAATSLQNNIPEPTEPQKEAGNYKKGHVQIHGLDISIENPAGSTRKGKGVDGVEWQTEMKNHYGYFKNTVGPDKDHVDVFLGPQASESDAKSFIVDQINPDTGKYDEPKVMMGFKTQREARQAYLSNYEDGWQGLGAISKGQTADELKQWLFEGNTKKPFRFKEPKPKKSRKAQEGFEPSKVVKRKTPPVPSKPTAAKYIPPKKRHSRIIKKMSKVFDVPVRVGKYRVGKRVGIYKPHEKVVRVASANDFQTVVHENAHHIQDILGWPRRHRFPREVRDMAYAGAKDKNREGFAEFVRYYVTDEQYAKKHAPTFYKEFEQHLAGSPDFQEVIIEARQAFNEFKAAPSVAKVGSFIVRGEDEKSLRDKIKRFKKRLPTTGQLYTELKDSLHPLKKVTDIAKKQNGRMQIRDDPYIVARLLRGWARKAQQFVNHRTFQYDDKSKHGVKFTGKSLIEILSPIERAGKMRELDVYLFAKRALSDERIVGGFDRILSVNDFKQTVKELEEEFKDTAEALYKYNDELLTYLTNSGRISEDEAKRIRSNNLFYTPLYRLMDQDQSVGSLGQKANNVFNPIKRLKGSSRDIISPTENILKNTYAMINAAERNRLGNAISKLSKVKGMGKYIERIPFPQKPVKLLKADFLSLLNQYGDVKRVEQIDTSEREFTKTLNKFSQKPAGKMENVAREALQTRGWTAAEADQIITRIKGAKTDDAKSNIVEKTIEKTTIMIIKEELGFTGMPDEVVATFRPQYKAGNNEAIFYQDGKPVLYELDPELYKSISSVSANEINLLIKFMSFPAKWLRAGATTFSTEFPIRNASRDQLTAWIQSKYGFVPGYDFLRGVFHMAKADEAWQLFNVSGAAHSCIVSMDRNYLSKNLKQLFRQKKAKGLTANPLAMMQKLSEYSEEASRVSEFTRSLKKEPDSLDGLFTSGFAGREVNLDFQRTGGSAAKSANMISAFWNARLEGIDKMVRTFKDQPVKASAKAFLGITLPSTILWWVQKDDPVYQELPSWRKTLAWNWVFHREGKDPFVLSIPKPFEYGLIFGSLPVAALDWAYRNDPTMFQETGESLGKTLDLLPIPNGLIVLQEWWANKSWFFDRPIVPRGKEGLEPVLQYGGRTSETVKLMAETMHKVPGLKRVASPAKIENMIQGFTASAGRTALQGLDWMLEKVKVVDVPPEPTMALSQMPGVRAVFSEFPKSHSQTIERFYKEYRKKKQKYESTKERMGIRGAGIKGTGFGTVFIKEEQVARQLSMLRKMARITYKSKEMTPDQKRTNLNFYYISMINKAREYYGLAPIILKKGD